MCVTSIDKLKDALRGAKADQKAGTTGCEDHRLLTVVPWQLHELPAAVQLPHSYRDSAQTP